ncbi:hypothetical protein FB192DRAFT_1400742 [Mucor lusitanicus]|uniref:Uncharacterized protein n=1 Tax=Mucor circinelloides f. lusitanicus TaxID=29924 RepID=A0A8H4EYA0_MUCCL|nr:hypothetical protein FB192DRAFT_1400742 [Mucor lusitanicus]
MVKRITRRPAARNSPDTLLRRKECVEKWSQTDMDYLSNCVFVDESASDINMRPSTVRSAKRHSSNCYYTIHSCSVSYHSSSNLCHAFSKYRDQIVQLETEEDQS